jgi:hypothetical protein
MHRPYLYVALFLVIGSSVNVCGQLSLGVKAAKQQFIQFEPIEIEVTIRNYSGETLTFTTDDAISGGLAFNITDKQSDLVEARSKSFNPASGLILPPGSTRRMVLAINQHFDLQQPTDYELIARIGHRRLKYDYKAEPVRFKVRAGNQVWHRQIGVPGGRVNDEIPIRDVSINMFHGDDGDLFYLKIEDENDVYAVIRLGPRVQGIQPQAEIDALNQIHVLVQMAPQMFSYQMIDLAGKIKQNKLYTVGRSMPRLIRDPDVGRVMVIGGKLAVDGIDFNDRAIPVMDTRKPELPESLFDD